MATSPNPPPEVTPTCFLAGYADPSMGRLCTNIVGAARRISEQFSGLGMEERTYGTCLALELAAQGYEVVRERPVEITYTPSTTNRPQVVATHFVDFEVCEPEIENRLVVAVEIKALTTSKLTEIHRAQARRYAHFLAKPT